MKWINEIDTENVENSSHLMSFLWLCIGYFTNTILNKSKNLKLLKYNFKKIELF